MIDLVVDGVFIGDAASVIGADGKQKIRELNICRVLTASAMKIEEADRLLGVEYEFVFLMDMVNQDILENGILRRAIDRIEASVRDGVNILVHCEYGVSRSVALVAGYIMKRFHWNVDKAILFIQKARPIASPNLAFLQQLSVFERLRYRLDAKTLATSSIFRNYCADTGTVPLPAVTSPTAPKHYSYAAPSTARKHSAEVGEFSGAKRSPRNSTACYEDEAAMSALSGAFDDNSGSSEAEAAAERSRHSLSDCARWARHRFRCRRCRAELFYDLHLMRHTRGGLRRQYSVDDDSAAASTLEKLALREKENLVEAKYGCDEYGGGDAAAARKASREEERCTFQYLITPMKWMDMSDYQGKICCPKCKEKLGQYIWSGRVCVNDEERADGHYKEQSCGAFVTPWVHIQKCKVDVSKMIPAPLDLSRASALPPCADSGGGSSGSQRLLMPITPRTANRHKGESARGAVPLPSVVITEEGGCPRSPPPPLTSTAGEEEEGGGDGGDVDGRRRFGRLGSTP